MSEILKRFLLLFLITFRLGRIRVVKNSEQPSQKRRIIMTQTQNNYWANVETKRHDVRMEELNMLEYLENQRSHRAQEANARYAAETAAAASRYSADQSYAGNVAKVEGTKYSADKSAATAKSNKRLEVTSNAAQKEADRQMNKYVAEVNAAIAREGNDIRRDANAITSAKNENDFQIAKDKLEQTVRDLDLKFKQFNFSKDKFNLEHSLDIAKFGLDKAKFNHQKWEDFWRDTRETTDTITNGLDKVTKTLVNLKYGTDFSDLLKQVRTISNALGGNHNG